MPRGALPDSGATAEAPPQGNVRHLRVAIIGSGFSGLGVAIKLREAGVEDFVILERASELGGTWRDNHYPGCCCDVPSHLYSFSFELNPHWTRGFAPQWEIRAYLMRVAGKYGVLPHIRYGHEVIEAAWDATAQRWAISTAKGDFTADFLVTATGALSDPKAPAIPGLESFEGKIFHSARWDHDHDLTGERVAVIGTGASAIQFVPAIQPKVSRLHLFQRTPPWIIPRLDHQITRPEHWALRWIPFAAPVVRGAIYGLLESRVIGFRRPRMMKAASRVAEAHLRRQIPDPELRAKLTPNYVMGCKRILISDNYYPALTKPNVEVLTESAAALRAHSIVTSDGTEREVDTIIFGTGFQVTEMPIAQRIRGVDGRALSDHWSGSAQAYLGTTVRGFPNMFMMTGPNTGLGHTSIYMIESQVSYVIDAIRTMGMRGCSSFEVRPEVQEAFNDQLQAHMRGTVWTAGNCKSWYLDAAGRNTTLWPGYTFDFRQRTRSFDSENYLLSNGGSATDDVVKAG